MSHMSTTQTDKPKDCFFRTEWNYSEWSPFTSGITVGLINIIETLGIYILPNVLVP